MNYFVKIIASDGKEVYVNPDTIKFITLHSPGIWAINLVGHSRDDPVLFAGDIIPLLEAVRQEPLMYSVPLLDTLLGPKPKP